MSSIKYRESVVNWSVATQHSVSCSLK